jgi:hypothetical protein
VTTLDELNNYFVLLFFFLLLDLVDQGSLARWVPRDTILEHWPPGLPSRVQGAPLRAG